MEGECLSLLHRDLFLKVSNKRLGWERIFEILYIESQVFPTSILSNEYGFIIIREVLGKKLVFPPFCYQEKDNDKVLKLLANIKFDAISHLDEDEVNSIDKSYLVEEDRNIGQYIYLTDDLATLVGKKYHPKRNFVNRFKAVYSDFDYQSYQSKDYEAVKTLLDNWYTRTDNKPEYDERKLIEFCLGNYLELGLEIYILSVHLKVIGIEILKINGEVAHILYEKCDTDFQGSYPTINYLTADHLQTRVKYINRQEDLGIESLRKAKLSYYPCLILTKFVAKRNVDANS